MIFILLFLTISSRNLDESFIIAGENSYDLQSALNCFHGQDRENLIWVINNLPEVDLVRADSALLINTILYPDSARKIFKWSADIPDDIWRMYVLYPRLSQEPLEDYRPYFFEVLYPILDTCSDFISAVNTLHSWATETVKFKPTQRRDQGPFETLKSGYGRCEELMIFNASACRTVGIPVREAFAPYWSFTDNNHAWTEVFIDGKWQYIGVSGNTTINNSWFSKHTTRTILICALAPGEIENPNKLRNIYGASLINSTSNYAQTIKTRITVLSDNIPVDSAYVSFAVFNWGAFRQILGLYTDSEGIIEVELGLTSVLIGAEKDNKAACLIIHPNLEEEQSFTLHLKDSLDFDCDIQIFVPPLRTI